MDKWLADYCCSQDGVFIIPIESLSPKGIAPAHATELGKRTGVEPDWFTRFNRAYSVYWERAGRLHSLAPPYWFPPRRQHVAIVTQADKVRPYFQPFHQNSWLLYEHDFDSGFSTMELSVFQFFQAERMGLLSAIVPALHANLPYFLTLSSAERRDFCRGCKLTDRPDAEGYQALGEAQSWLRSLYHEILRPPRAAIPGMRIQRENGLLVPPARDSELAALQETWGRSAKKVFTRYRAGFENSSAQAFDGLGEWLSAGRPAALITGKDGDILWDPDDAARLERLRPALTRLTPLGARRIRLDLEVVSRHSSRFLSTLINPEGLAKPAPYMTEGGLSYIHPTRRLIAYDIGPGRNENRLWEPSPPFERLMLGARTVHEWGHLAAESGWVVIPGDRVSRRETLTQRLAELFDIIPASASPSVRRLVASEEQRLTRSHGSFGKGLLAAMLRRIEDFMANLVARQFLSADEMDTYVRNNVASRITEYAPAKIYLHLTRLVYEYQYLSLSRIENPDQWFFDSAWVGPAFIDRGAITRARLEDVLETVAGICDCYEVDASRFEISATGDET